MLSISVNLRTRLGKGQLVVSHSLHVPARESGAESAITDGSIRAESSRRYVASVHHHCVKRERSFFLPFGESHIWTSLNSEDALAPVMRGKDPQQRRTMEAIYP